MHNTAKRNLEFKITWTENSIKWLLGEISTPENDELITKLKKILAEDKAQLEKE